MYTLYIYTLLHNMKFQFFIICIFFLSACISSELIGPTIEKHKEFDAYWNQGKAEITSYNLNQARYGEMRDGEAVLIFVTEEFSKSKQVKLDHTFIPNDMKVPVLKMNMTKRFHTGIYPYNMMLSSFVATGGVAPWQALKVTASIQEWCGHVFSQLNLRNDHYQYQLHSYFESDGEIDRPVNRYMTEDAVWNLIRINPEALIQSDSIMIIPNLLYTRLMHIDLKPYLARTSHLLLDSGNRVYHIEYPELKRSLYIEYEIVPPYAITKWSEEYKDGFGENAKVLTTTATKKKQLVLDYWTKNKNLDDSLRLALQ